MSKNMMIKIATAAVLIAIAVPVLYFGGIALDILVTLICCIAGYEIANMQTEKFKWLATVVNALFLLCMYFLPSEYFAFFAALYVTALFICVMFDDSVNSQFAAYTFTVGMLAGMALQCVPRIYSFDQGFIYMFYVAIACYVCDSGAYFFGVAFGKHKMVPRISPNKTWEGSVGGYVTAAIVSFLFGKFLCTDLPISLLITASLTLPLVAQLGDLSFSSIKRYFKIKDFGNLLPGHGGVLDRIDSLIFCLMFFNGLLVLWGI